MLALCLVSGGLELEFDEIQFLVLTEEKILTILLSPQIMQINDSKCKVIGNFLALSCFSFGKIKAEFRAQ